MTGTRFSLEIQPTLPSSLSGLDEIANDLLYSWDREVRRLFRRLDPALWDSCAHNPKLFLRRVSQRRLDEAAQDRSYVEDYHRAMSAYNTYHRQPSRPEIKQYLNPEKTLIAYFCAEFGFHESVPIYSGGLGILAGDHCKAASDLTLPFIGVGMLYRQGYFTQTIDVHGNQVAHYTPINFDHLPIHPATDSDGNPLHVHVDLPGRRVMLKVWQVKAGHICLYLLDSDLETNQQNDRVITYQLYGGDLTNRIQQEIVLGIGGVRALRALKLQPTVWHINEGHAAFLVLERCRELINQGMDYASAMELLAVNTVYTTHTPVAAGHDIFDRGLIQKYFQEFVGQLGISFEQFFGLGASPHNPNGFNMTALALRASRFHNGVSRIHGGVASEMERYIWPQVPAEENPIDYVTNGIHVATFLARGWANLFDMEFGREWRNELLNEAYWERIDQLPNHSYWSQHQSIKGDLLATMRDKVIIQQQRNGCSEAKIERMTRFINPEDTETLLVGFARRFATYKRATLLFSDPNRLARIVNNPERPMVLVFAGKAHPSDQPGQRLIKVIHEYSQRPEFEGRILLLEGYDIGLARQLVTGVDVWLNTPAYPLEASGTSGEKAGINGVINLSVLDGWWGEGFNGENGWAITPHGAQFDEAYGNQEEANDLLNILENQIIPTYYMRNGHGYSERWVQISKASMKSLLPRFNSQRMVMDYVKKFYSAAARQHTAFTANENAPARQLAAWKHKVVSTWNEVSLRMQALPPQEIRSGDRLTLVALARLGTLDAKDVRVECLVGRTDIHDVFNVLEQHALQPQGNNDQGEMLFSLEMPLSVSGLVHYKIRMYPCHALLTHPLEVGLMLWV